MESCNFPVFALFARATEATDMKGTTIRIGRARVAGRLLGLVAGSCRTGVVAAVFCAFCSTSAANVEMPRHVIRTLGQALLEQAKANAWRFEGRYAGMNSASGYPEDLYAVVTTRGQARRLVGLDAGSHAGARAYLGEMRGRFRAPCKTDAYARCTARVVPFLVFIELTGPPHTGLVLASTRRVDLALLGRVVHVELDTEFA